MAVVDPSLHRLIREIQGVQPTEEVNDEPEFPGHPQLPPLPSNPHGLTANINKSSEKVNGLESPFKDWQRERTGSSMRVDNKSSGRGECSSGCSSELASITDEQGVKKTMEDHKLIFVVFLQAARHLKVWATNELFFQGPLPPSPWLKQGYPLYGPYECRLGYHPLEA